MKPGSCGPGVLGIYPVIYDEYGKVLEADEHLAHARSQLLTDLSAALNSLEHAAAQTTALARCRHRVQGRPRRTRRRHLP